MPTTQRRTQDAPRAKKESKLTHERERTCTHTCLSLQCTPFKNNGKKNNFNCKQAFASLLLRMMSCDILFWEMTPT